MGECTECSSGFPGRNNRKVFIMRRTLRLIAAATVLAALSTLGASAAQAGDKSAAPGSSNLLVRADGWHW